MTDNVQCTVLSEFEHSVLVCNSRSHYYIPINRVLNGKVLKGPKIDPDCLCCCVPDEVNHMLVSGDVLARHPRDAHP